MRSQSEGGLTFWKRDGGAGVTKVLAHITAALFPYLAVVPGPGVQLRVLEAGGLLSKKL